MALVRFQIKIDPKLLTWLDETFSDSHRSTIITELLQQTKLAMDRGLSYEEVLVHLQEL